IPGLVAENLYSNIHLAIAAGSYVRLASAAVVGGDGNGRLDPGETAEIRIVLENAGVLAGADGVTATIACDDPYVQLIDASSSFGSIPAGGSASSASDPFTIAVDQGVPDGREIVFRVSMTWSGASNEETATFPIGAPIASDDFESGNHGWSQDPTHTASTGAWALVDPNPTAYQPGDDATPPPGAICWVTAQNSAEGTDDVDNGISALRSPVWDLSAHGSVALYINYFHGQRDPGDDAGDFFRIDLSNNGGATFPANLLLLGDAYHAPAWTALQVRLEDHLPLTSQMVLRLQAADGLASGDIVEAGIDDLALLSGGGGNEPPAAPLLFAPADGEPVGPAPELVLQNAVDPEADPLSYGFLVYSDSLLTSVVRAANAVPEGAGQTSWIVVPPLGDGTFWWRAYAEDWAAAGLCSAPFTFTIDASTGIAAGGAAAPFYAPTPNPATSAGTTIRFLLPSGGRVRADVFDAAGRRVRQIARGVFPAGVQTLQWDGRDQRGAEAAGGVYFVRIRTDEEERTVKVILVR
ncbi:MAG: T9SS C-terminal target domain-containing protein, partial [Candidatus Latescibacterota bacterium]